jgi:large subunit ribosomal protein L24
MQKKLHIKVGDSVKVLAGNHRGEEGKILSIDREKERAVIEGVNMISKHVKPSAANPQGGIEKVEGTIHNSNLAVVINGNAERLGRKIVDGKLLRYGKKSGEVIK